MVEMIFILVYSYPFEAVLLILGVSFICIVFRRCKRAILNVTLKS